MTTLIRINFRIYGLDSLQFSCPLIFKVLKNIQGSEPLHFLGWHERTAEDLVNLTTSPPHIPYFDFLMIILGYVIVTKG